VLLGKVEICMGRIIIIEDDIYISELLVDLAKAEKAEVLLFSDGKKAVNFFQLNDVAGDIVFVDYQMPEINGGEVIRFLAEKDFMKLFKVYLFSSLTEDFEEIRALKNDFNSNGSFYVLHKNHLNILNEYPKIIRNFVQSVFKKS
jgi:DNA-binding response OmpR family regulator